MPAYVNYYSCDQGKKGTGTIQCAIPTGVPTGFILVPKGWNITTADTAFDTTYINGQIKAKNFIPFLDAINYTNNDEEPQLFTTQLGVKLLARDGKPEFTMDFDKGYSFHAAAFSYNSFGSYDVIYVYDNGVMFAALSSDGTKLKGHTAGLVNTGNYMHRDGSNPDMTSITVQLTNPNEYNTRGALLDPVSNSFDVSDILPIIDTNITLVSNSTTDVVLTVKAASNSNVSITGLAATDFRATGTSETVYSLSYSSSTEQYTLTFTGDVSSDYSGMVIDLYDSDDSTTVVSVGGNHYQGSSAITYLN